jgi:RNA polymerase sigma factor (sigma-70 family)
MDEEKQWIHKIKSKGSKAAADKLVSKYYREIYAYIYRQTINKELSMDLAQEIFIGALKTISGYDDTRCTFKSWIYKIATYKLVDYYRSKEYKHVGMTATLPVDDCLYNVSDESDLAAALESRQDAQKIVSIIETFDAVSQQIIRLKIFGERTFAEIAAMLSIPESTVKTRYYSLIRKVKAAFEDGE